MTSCLSVMSFCCSSNARRWGLLVVGGGLFALGTYLAGSWTNGHVSQGFLARVMSVVLMILGCMFLAAIPVCKARDEQEESLIKRPLV